MDWRWWWWWWFIRLECLTELTKLGIIWNTILLNEVWVPWVCLDCFCVILLLHPHRAIEMINSKVRPKEKVTGNNGEGFPAPKPQYTQQHPPLQPPSPTRRWAWRQAGVFLRLLPFSHQGSCLVLHTHKVQHLPWRKRSFTYTLKDTSYPL